MTRRHFVSSAAAAAPLATYVDAQAPSADSTDLVELSAGDIAVEFDRTRGVLHSIRSKSDPLHTNFLGNSTNVRRIEDSHHMGDLVTAVWSSTSADRLASDIRGTTSQTSGGWRQELT